MKIWNKNKILLTLLLSTSILMSACSTSSTTDSSTATDESSSTSESNDSSTAANDYKNVASDGSFTIGSNGVIPLSQVTDDVTTVSIYFDPLCPGCAIYEQETGEYLATEAASGDVRIEYHPLMFLDSASSDTYSSRTSAYIIGVAEYAPDLALKFISSIFAEDFQPEEGDSYVATPTSTLDDLLLSLGGTDEQVKSINNDLTQNIAVVTKATYAVMSDNKLRQASPTGSLYTPFVIVNGPGQDDGSALKLSSDDFVSEMQTAIDATK